MDFSRLICYLWYDTAYINVIELSMNFKQGTLNLFVILFPFIRSGKDLDEGKNITSNYINSYPKYFTWLNYPFDFRPQRRTSSQWLDRIFWLNTVPGAIKRSLWQCLWHEYLIFFFTEGITTTNICQRANKVILNLKLFEHLSELRSIAIQCQFE